MKEFKDFTVAYFSMEMGIDPKIPTYAGGLGVLAGDTLRSCADLGVPVVGVTLLYKKGYFKQRIVQGNQIEEMVTWNPEALMQPLPNQITIQIEGRKVKVGASLYKLKGFTGHTNLILFLDTDVPGNSDYDKTITHHLYGGDERYRLAQEMVLGIGGVRMLDSLGCTGIKVYHMNEGHSSLLTLELSRRCECKDLIQDVRRKCVFTTHTPVPAGHDQFPKELAESMLGDMITDKIRDEIYFQGKLNMTFLGLRFSEYINGVAKKHGEISRDMFPGYHIESITNGVHSGYWTSEPFKALFNRYLKGWQSDPFSLRYVFGIPLEEIWQTHQESKQKLISFVNKKYNIEMDKETFTIGFARRSAAYKRGDLLFSNIQRLVKIAKKHKGIQIIYGGKAHPKDFGGKELIKKIISKMNELKPDIKCCYIEDYDMAIAKLLVSGVDLWLNTPMRPKEASGTSGMKAAHNGVPHFSVLDGWWLEGHIENVTGWSIGTHPDKSPENIQEEDIEDMYDKLEYIIVPLFHQEREKWIHIMRHAIAINGSFFNTHRMVQQYVLNAYFT